MMSTCWILPKLTPDSLQRIIPVARQLTAEDVALTIHTLEIYDDGFLINMRLDWEDVTGSMPRLDWRAIDGSGGHHFCCSCAGTGGLNYDRDTPRDAIIPHSWRMSCPFSYPLPADAGRLRVEVEMFRASRPVFSDDGSPMIKHHELLREVTDLGGIDIAL